MNLKKSFTISKFTFIEIYKSKIMINILISGFVLALLCYIVSEFSFGNPSKIALDVGLGFLSLTTKAIAIFFGATLLKNELESRTIYLILSNPVSRIEFLTGKVLGLSGILLLNTILLSVFTTAFYYFWDGLWSNLIAWSIIQIFLESVLILLIVIFFSLITNVNLAIIFSISVYVSGYAIRGVLELPDIKTNLALNKLVTIISYIIPNFSLFDIKNFVLYKQELESAYLFGTLGYSLTFSMIFLFVSSLVLSQKDLN